MSNWNKDVLLAENQILIEKQLTTINKLTEENEKLKQQLAEKEKEIGKLKDKLKRTEKAMHEEVKEHLEYYNADQKQLRHEICQEIRIEMTSIEPNCSIEDMNSNLYEFTGREIYTILDKIEKGDV